MREIIERLHENRQIELARSILESNGYAVEKEVQLRPIGDMIDTIYVVYENDTSGYLTRFIEKFLESHGASRGNADMFEGVHDRDIAELYTILYQRIVDQYGPDYENLSLSIINALGLDQVKESRENISHPTVLDVIKRCGLEEFDKRYTDVYGQSKNLENLDKLKTLRVRSAYINFPTNEVEIIVI